MAIAPCFSDGMRIFNDWIIPERLLQQRLGVFYRYHPIMSRLMVTPLAFLSGIFKVVLFPLICTVGLVVMPFIALIRSCRGQNGKNWLLAWSFCLLGVGASITYLVVTCYYLPLVASTAILVAALAVSLIFHVDRLVKEPIKPPSLETYLLLKNN